MNSRGPLPRPVSRAFGSKTTATGITTAVVGDNFDYAMGVSNNGPDPATSVTVTDNLPGSVTFALCIPAPTAVCGGSGNNRTVTFVSIPV